MHLSLQTDFALRILMALAASERQMSVDEIATSYGISPNHLSKVAQRLPVRISIDPDQDMAEFLEPGLSVVVTVDPGQGDGIAQTGAAVMGPRG